MVLLTSVLLSAMVLMVNSTDGGVNLKVSDKECYDLVRAATAVDQMDLVKMLILQGCDVNRPKGSHSLAPTPLHIAIINWNQRMANMFRQKGADMEAQMVLPREVGSGMIPMCKYLVQEVSPA